MLMWVPPQKEHVRGLYSLAGIARWPQARHTNEQGVCVPPPRRLKAPGVENKEKEEGKKRRKRGKEKGGEKKRKGREKKEKEKERKKPRLIR